MKIYLIISKSKWVREEKQPIKAVLNKEVAEKIVEDGVNIFYKFERFRHKCDRLDSLNHRIWEDNRPIKTKIQKSWQYDQEQFREIYYEETKLLLSEEELRYHYKYCEENNLVHIRCYDAYEIVEMDVE